MADTITNSGISPLGVPARNDRTTALALHIHRYLPVAAFYFFLNSAGLPLGLFYTTIFSPFLYLWLYLKGRRWITATFLLVLSPFILAHMVNGVASPLYYLRSLLLLWSVYIAVYAFSWALMNSNTVERLFEQLILLNFCAAILALIIRPTPMRLFLWRDEAETVASTAHLLRLNLLSMEPSAYANLMLPLLVFAALRLLRESKQRNFIYLMMIAVPFLLAQSFGGLSIAAAGITVTLLTSYRRLLSHPKPLAILACLTIALGVLLLTQNPISERVFQVAAGGDSSTKSRTNFSFVIAYVVATSKSLWWGAGIGQAKLFDVSNLGIGFTIGVIPNAVAGTFAEFGLIGILLRFVVELYLFFRTRVYLNSFRLAMFVVAFIVQLTGSYITDVQEYMLWCFAFYPFFPELNLRANFKSQTSHP